MTLLLLLAFNANAWMDKWAPPFKAAPAKVRALPAQSVRSFVLGARDAQGGTRYEDIQANYSTGGALDLNGDGIEDFVFIIPWMGCGLAACGSDVLFIVSDGAKGRKETVMEGYGVELSDFVTIAGKIYFRHSTDFSEFEKSRHNHWVFQMFSFDRNGVMRCANGDVGRPFPAVTIFYENPKFRQIELTAADSKKIAEKTKPVSLKYVP